MKKTLLRIYIVAGLLVCVLPFAAMTVCPTDTTTENRTLAGFPSLQKEGKPNVDFFEEISAYFNDHFAFRNELVSIDAKIMNRVFGVSNVDTVVTGKDGWLYYTDSVDDYLGQNTLNERQVFNTVNNLRILQQYVKDNDAQFVFTVAPNKSSLYGEHMPNHLSKKVSDVKNIKLLTPQLEAMGIQYVDLFSAFEEQPEVLYLKRDSHWNNKGAALAYNTIMDKLMYEHDTFETVSVERRKTEVGDLGRMLYPVGAEPEWNYQYENVRDYNFTSENDDVEAAWLATECKEAEGSLLMFRDSFGNTLLPFMAQQFEKSYFTKEATYDIARYMEELKPELVVVEKVERNLDEYMSNPSVLPAPQVNPSKVVSADTVAEANAVKAETELNVNYWTISGTLKTAPEDVQTKIIVHLTYGEESCFYEAYTTTTEDSDYGYQIYLPKDEMIIAEGEKVDVEILTGTDEEYTVVEAGQLK